MNKETVRKAKLIKEEFGCSIEEAIRTVNNLEQVTTLKELPIKEEIVDVQSISRDGHEDVRDIQGVNKDRDSNWVREGERVNRKRVEEEEIDEGLKALLLDAPDGDESRLIDYANGHNLPRPISIKEFNEKQTRWWKNRKELLSGRVKVRQGNFDEVVVDSQGNEVKMGSPINFQRLPEQGLETGRLFKDGTVFSCSGCHNPVYVAEGHITNPLKYDELVVRLRPVNDTVPEFSEENVGLINPWPKEGRPRGYYARCPLCQYGRGLVFFESDEGGGSGSGDIGNMGYGGAGSI